MLLPPAGWFCRACAGLVLPKSGFAFLGSDDSDGFECVGPFGPFLSAEFAQRLHAVRSEPCVFTRAQLHHWGLLRFWPLASGRLPGLCLPFRLSNISPKRKRQKREGPCVPRFRAAEGRKIPARFPPEVSDLERFGFGGRLGPLSFAFFAQGKNWFSDRAERAPFFSEPGAGERSAAPSYVSAKCGLGAWAARSQGRCAEVRSEKKLSRCARPHDNRNRHDWRGRRGSR